MLFVGLAALALAALPAEAQAQPSTGPAQVPFQAEVSDELLEPLPSAERQIQSWEEAIQLARNLSTDERVALANVERAAGRSRQALAALLPNIRAEASVTLNVLEPGQPPVGVAPSVPGIEKQPTAPLGTARITATQTIFDLGAHRSLAAARASEESASYSLKEVRRRISLSLARSLVAVAAAERVSEMNRQGLRLALERAAMTERQFQLGAATQLDLMRVQQDLKLARDAVVAGDEQVRRAREALGLALGLDHEVGISPSFKIEGLVEESLRQCRRLDSISERADIAAARAELEAARKRKLEALAGYYPTLGLTTSLFGYTTDPPFGRVGSWNVAAVLSVPIWEGGLRGGMVREREGAEWQAEEALEKARRDAVVEVTRAHRNVQVAEERLKTAMEARQLAERADQLTRRSFEIGRATSFELVQSASALRQADISLAMREFEWVEARLSAFLTEATCEF